MANNKSIKGIIEKRLMEYAYTVTGYMGNEEIKSGCIPKAIIKKVAGNIADDLKKQYRVVASGEALIRYGTGGGLIGKYHLKKDIPTLIFNAMVQLKAFGKDVEILIREL